MHQQGQHIICCLEGFHVIHEGTGIYLRPASRHHRKDGDDPEGHHEDAAALHFRLPPDGFAFSFAPGGDHSCRTEELLEACECIANLLEGGQLCPMDVPPTYRIAMYRKQEKPDADEIKRFLAELVTEIKKACYLV